MLFSGSMMLLLAGRACVWQIPRRGPKCLKVVWLSTRAEEQPLTLLVISYRRCRRHKERLQEVMEDKKTKKAPSLLQISRSIKANAAEPGSPYRSSLDEIYPPHHHPGPPSASPWKGAQDEWPTLLQRSMCSQTAAPSLFCSLCSLYYQASGGLVKLFCPAELGRGLHNKKKISLI